VASLVFGDWTMFVQGILLGYVVWIFLDVLRHEYIEHGYLKLRWSILDIPFRWISYHLSPALYHDDLISTNHTLHHSKWKTSSDELTKRVKQEFIPGFLDYDLGFLSQPKNVNQLSWPYKYYIEFKIILLVILSIEYGFANVFYYALLPLSITGFLQLQHDYYIRWLGERDHPWMFFLAYNQAWHYSHHISYKKKPNLISDLFMGPSWVKYINPQYYFTLIFFKLNSSVSGQ
jgi:hypothetical protein